MSAFLAGVVRRVAGQARKDEAAAAAAAAAAASAAVTVSVQPTPPTEEAEAAETAAEAEAAAAEFLVQSSSNSGDQQSRSQRNRTEAREIQALLAEEGVLDEEDGRAADDLDKLTGVPTADDTLLYAVPVCGPFASLDNYKYRIKLTAGGQKKGKAAKMAVELFTRDAGSICSPQEKALMKQMSDPEMVAIMLGDVKLSAPGLFAAQRSLKGKSVQPRKKPRGKNKSK
jgi:hypothetical protein